MTETLDYLQTSKLVWARAANFSADKEGVYPDHARVGEFNEAQGLDVLEYGCGGGSDAMSFLRRGCRVWALDIVPENITTTKERVQELLGEQARSRLFPQLLAESAEVPIQDSAVDRVNCHGVLHHIVDPQPVVAEFARVLKPGGQAFIMLYTEHLFQLLAPNLVMLLNHRGLDVYEAFGELTDGPGVPYSKAYDIGAAAVLFAPYFDILGYREYNNKQFRTFKLERRDPNSSSLDQMDIRNLDAV